MSASISSSPAAWLKTSSTLTVGLITVVVSVVVSMFIRSVRRHLLLPPGPWFLRVTLLRSLLRRTPSTAERLDKIYTRLSRRWGKIFSYGFGGDTFVVMSDPSVIREAFVHQRSAFSGRVTAATYAKSNDGDREHRIILGNGRPWKTARRVVSPCLRNVGSWGEQMETIILSEADCLNDRLASHDAAPFDPCTDISLGVANVIHSMVHGFRLEYDNPKLQEMIDMVTVLTARPFVGSDALNYLPFLYRLPSMQSLKRAFQLQKGMMTTAVNEQATSYDNGSIKTIIERIILAAQEDQVEGQGGLKTKEIWRIVGDLINAGSDTTANSLKWSVLFMAFHQDIQRRVHGEIDSMLQGESPCAKDRRRMPYTQAVISELLRLRPVLPLALPHLTTETTVLEGYTIPKGAILLANVWACHHDPDYWSDPEEFNPDRFLSEDRQSLCHEPRAYMPFSVGPRMCLGDQFAKTELFLIFTKIMQRFDVDFAPGARPDKFDEGVLAGVILRPNEMMLCLTPRTAPYA